jgi:hypothetical protein
MTLDDFNILRPNYALLNKNHEIRMIQEELNYNNDILNQETSLNSDQKKIYDTIIDAVNGNTDKTVFFVDGPRGYEKTFLFNMILARIRSNHGIAIAVASSGIAALLLNGGRTAHSKFKIPLKLNENSTLNIKNDSELAELI